jgi:hypothetical protein
MTMTDSTVAGNTGEQGGGINNNSTLVLTNVTVSGNTATILFPFASGSGGGISNLASGTLTLTNSTVSGNAASSTSGGILSFGTLTLTNSTVAGNEAPQIQGIRNGFRGTLTITKTVVEGDCATESEATTTSGGYNVESPGNTCGFEHATDLFDIPATVLNLGALQNNGGPTMTHALLTTPTVSIAIDAIPETDCLDADGDPLTTDQRGLPRPVPILGPEPKCDVGAFEVQP